MPQLKDMSLASVRRFYEDGATPQDLVELVIDLIRTRPANNAWIHVASGEKLRKDASELERRKNAGEELPLFGIPFGVKDNIDVGGMLTTAACPDYAYTPTASAASVDILQRAGAICIGKTNLDQFATGLSGARSPYGVCASIANPEYVSGGSSSGSAVVVAAGHATFALGTDTGGSGRIPAGFNGVTGIKPTVGRVSSRGLVPNCPSIDCVSIFCGTATEGAELLSFIDGYDERDPYSRPAPIRETSPSSTSFRFGRLAANRIETFGMDECASLYEQACRRLEAIGGKPVDVNFAPFAEAGMMLFGGPWIAERRASLEPFAKNNPGSLLEVTAKVLAAADDYDGVDVFVGMRRLRQLHREVETVFKHIDVLVVPTAPRPFTVEAMLGNPVELNNQLGYYTHGANLLDLCGVAVPNGMLSCGVPMGVTLLGPAWHDGDICRLAARFELAAESARKPAMAGVG